MKTIPETDLQSLRLAGEKLRESEERFRLLAETMPSIVWTSDPDGVITYANRRWLEYCGLREPPSAYWPELPPHPDDRDRCVSEWRRALKEGREYEAEVRHRRHDGHYRWFMTRAVPHRAADGCILGWFGVTTDIHEQKELQERLREADRRKDEFMATLAHELRNPLAAICNAVQLLRHGAAQPEEQRLGTEVIERQARLLTRLVEDLLDISRITRGLVKLRKESIELAEIIQSTVEISRPSLDHARHRVALTLPAEPVPLDADPVRLSQALSNLLNNAAKYTPPGGRIELRAGVEDGEAVIRLRDSGVGIPREVLPRIFEPFTQGLSAEGLSRAGIGIGLALARQLVQFHGGRIEAHSEGTGKGSEFVVRLPLPTPARDAPAAAEAKAEPAAATASRRILVVDDHRDASRILSLLLDSMGHEVRMAHNGRHALEEAAAFEPDVVFLDIGLPEMDGYEVARRMRQQPRGKDLRLIALTGWGHADDRRRSQEAGFDHHLVKPVTSKTLRELLANNKGSAAAQN